MNEKQLNEELSAYLDEESTNPNRIARLLQTDERAARRYMELSKLSAHLKALPEPDVHPAFATRVLAEVREAPQVRNWSRVGRRVTAGVVVLLLVGVLSWVETYYAPVTPIRDPEVTAVLELRHSDNPTGPLASLFDADLLAEPVDVMADDVSPWEEDELHAYEESVDAAVESIVWLASTEPAGSNSEDVEAMVGTLNDTEIAVLKDLLVEYATEDSTI